MCKVDVYGAVFCGKLHPAPVVDRLATKNPRTKYTGEGICLGAYVTGRGKALPWQSSVPGITGQIWAQAEGRGNWWVVTETGSAYIMHDSTMTLAGQALTEDAPLFEVSA